MIVNADIDTDDEFQHATTTTLYLISRVEDDYHGDDLLHLVVRLPEGQRLLHGRVALHDVLQLGRGHVVVLISAAELRRRDRDIRQGRRVFTANRTDLMISLSLST